jgi:hypothetical protein
MKIRSGKISELEEMIRVDLMTCSQLKVDKRVASNLAECAACVLATQSVNSCEWMAVLPRKCEKKAKELHIRRVLSSPLINTAEIMSYYISEVVRRLSGKERTIVLMMDQSQIHEDRQCLMISLRFGEPAIPVLWRVEDTKGNIGFDKQEELLNKVKEMMPPEIEIMLSADRFYGTKNLVEWCQKAGWHYRLRLKGNLIFEHEGGEISAAEIGKMPNSKAIGAIFNNSNISTNIGYLHEENHPEPWIIAMDCDPSKYRILDYGMRWGIECMFSDFKSRGFTITDTHVRKTDRLEKLILILTVALFWAVSVGMTPKDPSEQNLSKKNCLDQLVPLLNEVSVL